MIFLRKKCSFPRYRPLRSVLFGVLPPHSDQRKAGTPALRLLRMFHLYNSFFFYQTFSPLSVDFPRSSCRRTRRLPSPREVGVRCPLYIIGVKQSADCLHSPLLRPFLPTDAVSRSKRHRGTLETPYPGPKQILRRWKCRIFNFTKHFDARYDISLIFINILALDTSYP